MTLLVALVVFPANATGQGWGKWTIRAPLPSPRTEVAAAQLQGKIFLVGGLGRSGNLFEEFDPGKNIWRRRASLPRPPHHVGTAAIGGKIYVIGGYLSGRGPVDTVYAYDPSADKWQTRTPMPTARGALTVGIIGGKIYAVGGVGTNKKTAAPTSRTTP